MSISVAIGFIALSGVAILKGLVVMGGILSSTLLTLLVLPLLYRLAHGKNASAAIHQRITNPQF